ncbi:MAG TPA: excalibur calcium-binding domain-containing protein [Solirubrobacterales bacterium]|nr:excalibur calcium-binding domain-containing protein [Solirubrobacterales bacterium]
MKVFLSLLPLAMAFITLGAPPAAAAASDYDCADFANQAEAEEYLLPGDPYNLDADNDGIACEDLPCPCSSTPGQGAGGGGEEEQPAEPPLPYHLKMSTARHLALQVARQFTRRDPNVGTTELGRCHRRGERRIGCAATAHGEIRTSRTTCNLWIAVRAIDRNPRATLTTSQCHTYSLVILTAARAAEAFRTHGAGLAHKPVAVGLLERRTRVSFFGTAEWTQPHGSEPTPEECFALMEAKLKPDNEVRVTVIETGCSPPA